MSDASGKTCPGCGKHKLISEYGIDRQKKDNLTSRCLECRRVQNRRYAASSGGRAKANEASARYAKRHPERVVAAREAWRVKNPGYSARSNREWRAANPDAAAIYYEAHRDRIRERNAKWLAENANRKRETDRAWQAANLARRSASVRKWQKAHPEKAREIALRRRARKFRATAGRVDVDLLWKTSLGFCALCSGPINRRRVYPDPMSKSLDHIVPLSKGGSHSQSNVQWTHLVCNLRKGATVPD